VADEPADPVGLYRRRGLAAQLGWSLAAPWLGGPELQPHRNLPCRGSSRVKPQLPLPPLIESESGLTVTFWTGPSGSLNVYTFPDPPRCQPTSGSCHAAKRSLLGGRRGVLNSREGVPKGEMGQPGVGTVSA
jgi:hypothetical protein